MEGRKKSLFSRPEAWLACALVLILAGSLLGGLFHSSFSKVKITEIEFETEQGLLNGLLYMPEGAGENDPPPRDRDHARLPEHQGNAGCAGH